MLKRIALGLVGLYLLTAIATKLAEQAGVIERCGCKRTCWCQRPGLSLFRWVAPVRHDSYTGEEKATFDQRHTSS